MTKWATVISDASFCPQTKAAGWAVWIRMDSVPEAIKLSGNFRGSPSDPFEAELFAACNGIHHAFRLGADAVLLQTDCLTVVHLYHGKIRNRRLVSAFNCARERAGILGKAVRAKHIKGHTTVADARSYVNRWCDQNAKSAMKVQRKERRHATS